MGEHSNRKRPPHLILTTAMAVLILLAAIRIVGSPITNVSAIGTSGVGVYWDQVCTQKATAISWGELHLGETKSIVLFVRNEGTNTTYLDISSANWTPANAKGYINFKWSCATAKIKPTQTIQITIILTISRNIAGISTFSFDTFFQALATIPTWDVNNDGRINISDVIVIAQSINTTPSSPKWNPDADVNVDKEVNILDLIVVDEHLNLNYI